MKKLKIAAIVAAVICLTACSSVEQKSIEMTYDKDYYLGESEWIEDPNIKWESKDSAVVSVGAYGLLHAEKPGKTTVLARNKEDHNKVVGIYKCEVETIPIKHISFPMTFDVAEGDTKQFDYTLSPTDASNYGIKWTTDDDSIIKIWDGNGTSINIEGLTNGTATLTATTDEEISQTCKVRVIPEIAYPYLNNIEKNFVDLIVPTLKEVHHRNSPIIFTKVVWLFGNQYDFEYEVTKEDGSKITKVYSFGVTEGEKTGVVWESSGNLSNGKSLDAALITQAEKRLWEGHDDSKLAIAYYDNDVDNSEQTSSPVERLTFAESTITIKAKETKNIDYEISPADASESTISWSVENPKIATIRKIDNKEAVKGVKEGETTLIATLEDGTQVSCAIKVVAD